MSDEKSCGCGPKEFCPDCFGKQFCPKCGSENVVWAQMHTYSPEEGERAETRISLCRDCGNEYEEKVK